MNDYQKLMAQVLKTKAAIDQCLHETWILMSFEKRTTRFGDGLDRDALNDMFSSGLDLSAHLLDQINTAHFG